MTDTNPANDPAAPLERGGPVDHSNSLAGNKHERDDTDTGEPKAKRQRTGQSSRIGSLHPFPSEQHPDTQDSDGNQLYATPPPASSTATTTATTTTSTATTTTATTRNKGKGPARSTTTAVTTFSSEDVDMTDAQPDLPPPSLPSVATAADWATLANGIVLVLGERTDADVLGSLPVVAVIATRFESDVAAICITLRAGNDTLYEFELTKESPRVYFTFPHTPLDVSVSARSANDEDDGEFALATIYRVEVRLGVRCSCGAVMRSFTDHKKKKRAKDVDSQDDGHKLEVEELGTYFSFPGEVGSMVRMTTANKKCPVEFPFQKDYTNRQRAIVEEIAVGNAGPFLDTVEEEERAFVGVCEDESAIERNTRLRGAADDVNSFRDAVFPQREIGSAVELGSESGGDCGNSSPGVPPAHDIARLVDVGTVFPRTTKHAAVTVVCGAYIEVASEDADGIHGRVLLRSGNDAYDVDLLEVVQSLENSDLDSYAIILDLFVSEEGLEVADRLLLELPTRPKGCVVMAVAGPRPTHRVWKRLPGSVFLHALAKVLGQKPRLSARDAVSAVRCYINIIMSPAMEHLESRKLSDHIRVLGFGNMSVRIARSRVASPLDDLNASPDEIVAAAIETVSKPGPRTQYVPRDSPDYKAWKAHADSLMANFESDSEDDEVVGNFAENTTRIGERYISRVQGKQLVPVEPYTPEWLKCESWIKEKAAAEQNLILVGVERIDNPRHRLQYHHAAERLRVDRFVRKAQNPRLRVPPAALGSHNYDDLNETELFYVSTLSQERLADEGIDVRRARGGYFGSGIYLLQNPADANKRWQFRKSYGDSDGNYKYTAPKWLLKAGERVPFEPKDRSLRWMVLCKVLLGQACEYPPNTCDSELLLPPQGFDSVSGLVYQYGTGRFHILYDSDRVMPQYILWYKDSSQGMPKTPTNAKEETAVNKYQYFPPSKSAIPAVALNRLVKNGKLRTSLPTEKELIEIYARAKALKAARDAAAASIAAGSGENESSGVDADGDVAMGDAAPAAAAAAAAAVSGGSTLIVGGAANTQHPLADSLVRYRGSHVAARQAEELAAAIALSSASSVKAEKAAGGEAGDAGAGAAEANSAVNQCTLCLEDLREASGLNPTGNETKYRHVGLSCGHFYHANCLLADPNLRLGFLRCSQCNSIEGKLVGRQPIGVMTWEIDNTTVLEGRSAGAIKLFFSIPASESVWLHAAPGEHYQGYHIDSSNGAAAYIPNSEAGQRVFAAMKAAFRAGVMFDLELRQDEGDARPVYKVASLVPLKTRMTGGGRFGYPDPSYETEALEAIHSLGVTPNDYAADLKGEVIRSAVITS